MRHRTVPRKRLQLALALLLPLAGVALGVGRCQLQALPASGHQLFLSPESNPMTLSEDGTRLYVANTTSGTLSVLDVTNPTAPKPLAEIKVGMDPTGVAVLPGGVNGDELVFVANHISDSISVVSRNRLAVIQTLEAFDADGVTETDEPVAVAFSGPNRAFVTLDQPNQVLVLDVDANGHATIAPDRIQITAQAPRALTVADGRLFVVPFESGNQTEFPSCWPGDTRGLNENDAIRSDEGCEFIASILGTTTTSNGIQLGTIFQFAAQNPNIGGRVIRDTNIPDRDLFVIDAQASTPAITQTLTTIGTLLSGIAAHTGPTGTRVWIAHTEARNEIDGLRNLDNHLFENRVAVVDCGLAPSGSCSLTDTVDLDASAAAAGLGQTVPTPWGIQVSGDGQTLVVTAAGADGDPGDGRPPMHGLFTLDAGGHVLGSALVGALPEGVVLRSGPTGAAQVAYVLNTPDSTVSVVDVSDPAHPHPIGSALTVGHDPTPPEVRLGRIAFHSARGSTNHTFACGSCHPNGNMDQLQWTINTVNGPNDGPDPNGATAEPRTTMPIRGLRDTLPLHWDGSLGDPYPQLNPKEPFDPAPDCDLATDGEVGCVLHLVNAALAGPNCQHNTPDGCVPGPGQTGSDGSNLPGALTNTERHAMAAFLLSVAYPPAPARRPTDVLSPLARQGVSDFFTNEDRQGINTGIGQVVGFAPTTCADNPMGCHSLPLTVSTNSSVVGGFDAPSARGLWDRFTLFSDGMFSSEEVLRGAQDCADGIEPPAKVLTIGQLSVPVTGDPCDLHASNLLGFTFASLPFPSHEQIYDPAVGMTERGSFIATFEGIFGLVYGIRGDAIWQFQTEIGTGLPGLTGRQVSIDPNDAQNPDTVKWMDLIESYAGEGRVTAVAESPSLHEMRYDPNAHEWSSGSGWMRSGYELRDLAHMLGEVVTITADLPENMTIGGPDRQPLLDVDPDLRAAEVTGDPPSLPRPFEGESATFRLGAQYVDPAASVLVDGVECDTCSFTPAVAPNTGKSAIDMTLDPGLSHGVHVMQLLNPSGWASNEMPICVTNVEAGHPLPPVDQEACRPYKLAVKFFSVACPTGQVAAGCSCSVGPDGAVRDCSVDATTGACDLTAYCYTGTCSSWSITPVGCAAP
jgi:YVTN family beta-propeller protein